MGDYTVETRSPPFKWNQPSGWGYLGHGELVAEIQDAEGLVLETFPMPRQTKR